MDFDWLLTATMTETLFLRVELFGAGFLSGSIPYGLLIARFLGKGDVRLQGSGNIGATNVARIAGKKAAAATFLADALKGYIPCVLATYFAAHEAIFFCAMGAILGHVFSPFLKFKGGKGVATMIGGFLALFPLIACIGIAGWIGTFLACRVSSLAAFGSLLALMIGGVTWGSPGEATFIFMVTLFIFGCHHENFKRILSGDEKAFSKK